MGPIINLEATPENVLLSCRTCLWCWLWLFQNVVLWSYFCNTEVLLYLFKPMISKINRRPCVGGHFLSGRIVSTLRSLMFCLFGTFPALLFTYFCIHLLILCVYVWLCVMCEGHRTVCRSWSSLTLSVSALTCWTFCLAYIPIISKERPRNVCRLTSFTGPPACNTDTETYY